MPTSYPKTELAFAQLGAHTLGAAAHARKERRPILPTEGPDESPKPGVSAMDRFNTSVAALSPARGDVTRENWQGGLNRVPLRG